MGDPLQHYYSILGYEKPLIKRMVAGTKYVGIMLTNGQIGVCSTLNKVVSVETLMFEKPDLSVSSHRMLYNAYINAHLNYSSDFEDKKDIFQHIDFSEKSKIVMVGYFRPVVKKFLDAGIDLSVFDLIEKDDILLPLDQLNYYLGQAATVILTSTSIANGSFVDILTETSSECEVFLLGPSSILHWEMMNYRNIKKIYGAVFDLNDHRILDIIADGNGTQTFLKYGEKVNI